MCDLTDDAHELKLYIENDYDIYKNMLEPTYKTLELAKRNEVFKENVAVKIFLSVVRYGAASYHLRIGKNRKFKLSDQMQVATDLLSDWEVEYKSGTSHLV
jgi:hypothetical protein